MPTYGRVKVDTITYDLSGTATDVSVSNIATKASPTFTGTVTVPTASANDNTTKAASTAYVQTELGDYALKASPAFTGTATGVNLTLSGDLTVNGTTTTINTTTLQVEDKNIEIGKVSTPSDATADGGGLTLLGATNKTWNWVNATDAWTSSEHIHLLDNKKLFVGGASGTTDGLEIYHSGSHSNIKDAGTGQLNLWSNTFQFYNAAGNKTSMKIVEDAQVELYYDNSKKLETASGGVTVTGTVSDSKGDLRKIIQNTQGSAYTLVAADAGKHILASGNITIPNSIFSAGDGVVIVNNTSGDLTITSGITNLYLGTDGSTGNKTLASRCTCTVLFTSGTAGYISGGGLS